MKFKRLTGCVTGFCLLTGAAMADAASKGVINTLNLETGSISIDYKNMRLTDKTRVRSVDGSLLGTDDLAVRQHVSYRVNELGQLAEIRIYDLHQLKQQGFYSGNELSH